MGSYNDKYIVTDEKTLHVIHAIKRINEGIKRNRKTYATKTM